MSSTFRDIGHTRQAWAEHGNSLGLDDTPARSILDMIGCLESSSELITACRLDWALHVKKLDHYAIYCHIQSYLSQESEVLNVAHESRK
eukprot:4453520-Karenia_brevis.AAC.1